MGTSASQGAASANRTALVGAGFIADVHASVLANRDDVAIRAVVDPDPTRAGALARRLGVDRIHANVDELIAAGDLDSAHVLVPPDLHRAVAEPLLRAGIPVLLEKPLASTRADADALIAAARDGNTLLGVNQNFVHHPAQVRLRQIIESGAIGRLGHVSCLYNVALRQLAAGQYGHWMFRQPLNILLEQAVHPLSQIVDLIGPIEDLGALAPPARHLAPGIDFYDKWQVSLRGARASAQLLMAVGQDYPAWRLVAVGSDGIASADVFANRVSLQTNVRWPDFIDHMQAGMAPAWSEWRQSLANAGAYLLSTLKLRADSDPFYRSMAGAIGAFHDGVRRGELALDGAFGRDIVGLCEDIRDRAIVRPGPCGGPKPTLVPAAPEPAPDPVANKDGDWDVTVLGGTGFIGRHLVRALLRQGRRVGVLARGTAVRPDPLDDPGVCLIRGDVANADDVARAIGQARLVVNLAQGAAGDSAAEIEAAMCGAALAVAQACRDGGVDLLVHASTIAALYLGDPHEVITDATPTDPRRRIRGEYANAKAASEDALMAWAAANDLRVAVLRPGVVIGAGGLAFHSGLGLFNRERHCLGWNRGDNPLPFVLVEDVAEAIVAALERPETVAGRRYNLVGDGELSARDYIAALARASGRPLRFHPQSLAWQQGIEVLKWLVKQAIGRRQVPFPSYRDLRSRGMTARFDCAGAKRDLDWRPAAGRDELIRRGIAIFAPER